MTLIELLVVLIILGILGAVSVRAMDTTRERANYNKTMRNMEQISQAMIGNPNLIAEGLRTDFGFIGDMGRMPESLGELVTPPGNNPAWNGPYVRVPFTGDTRSWRIDGWGNELSYVSGQGEIVSLGNGTFPMTYVVAADTMALLANRVTGTVTDNQGNAPGTQAPEIIVRLWVTDPVTGEQDRYDTNPDPGGRYEFAPPKRIPVGNHMLRVVHTGLHESLTKFIQVAPRVGAIADVRLPVQLTGSLRLLGMPQAHPVDSLNKVLFSVVNTAPETIWLHGVWFFRSDTPPFCEDMKINFAPAWSAPPGGPRAGWLDSMPLSSGESIAAVPFTGLPIDLTFRKLQNGPSPIDTVRGRTFNLRFEDGSVVNFTVP